MVLETLNRPEINVKKIVTIEPPKKADTRFNQDRDIPTQTLDTYRDNVYSVIQFAYNEDGIDGVNELIPLSDLKFVSENHYNKLISKPNFSERITINIKLRLVDYSDYVKDGKHQTMSDFLSLYVGAKDFNFYDGGFPKLTDAQRKLYIINGIKNLKFSIPRAYNNIVNLIRVIPATLPEIGLDFIKEVEDYSDIFQSHMDVFNYRSDDAANDLTHKVTWLVKFTQLAANRKILAGLINSEFNVDENTWKNIRKNIVEFTNETIPLRDSVMLFRSFRNLKILAAEKTTIDSEGNIVLTERREDLDFKKPEMPVDRSF